MAPDSATRPPVLVITGASAGVGRATALQFAHNGAKIGVIAREATALDELARELREAGSTIAVAARSSAT